MRILVFGGSFDPPHLGHQELLKRGYEHLRPDLTIVLPSYLSPFKEHHYASFSDRMNMAKAMAEDVLPESKEHPSLRMSGSDAWMVDDFEGVLGKVFPCWKYLERLLIVYPDPEVWFLIGSDILSGLKDWKRIEWVSRYAKFLVGVRMGTKIPDYIEPEFEIMSGVMKPYSSTEIRKALRSGTEPSFCKSMPIGVQLYIKEHDLYPCDTSKSGSITGTLGNGGAAGSSGNCF